MPQETIPVLRVTHAERAAPWYEELGFPREPRALAEVVARLGAEIDEGPGERRLDLTEADGTGSGSPMPRIERRYGRTAP